MAFHFQATASYSDVGRPEAPWRIGRILKRPTLSQKFMPSRKPTPGVLRPLLDVLTRYQGLLSCLTHPINVRNFKRTWGKHSFAAAQSHPTQPRAIQTYEKIYILH